MKINVFGPINCLSYGYITQNLIKAFLQLGHEVNLQNLNNKFEVDEEAGYGDWVDKCHLVVDDTSPNLIIWHYFGLSQYCKQWQINLGFPVFEINQFTEKDVQEMESCSAVLVASKWYKSILERTIDKPIFTTPLGVDTDIFNPKNYLPAKKDGTVKFLNIGKWELRKGHPELVQAFGEEFKNEKDVSLTLVCNNSFLSKEENLKWVEYARKWCGNKVQIFPHKLNSAVQIAALINSHDVGVFPSKCEGWNMPLVESMAMGKHVITTKYSGHTEFCHNLNSFLIDIDSEERCYDGQFFFGNGTWAKLGPTQIRQLCGYMRRCYNTIKESYQKSNKKDDEDLTINTYGVKIAETFSWQECARKIVNVIQYLQN